MHSSKIISKLNRETKDNNIKWEINRSKPIISGNENLIDNVYTTKVLDKVFRLYHIQSKYYFQEDAYEWSDNYRLEFVDHYGNSEWIFPDDRAIFDLYETVRYKTSKFEEFMNKYLTEEDQKDDDDF